MNDISRFMDENGRIKTWAAKNRFKYEILKYISTKFVNGRFYTEKEVNALIAEWHTFGDYFMIRRGLIDNGFLSRTKDGSRYWKEDRDNCKDIINLIEGNYEIENVKNIFHIKGGYGSQVYYVSSGSGEYIFKEQVNDSINHPENESVILDILSENDIPVSKICCSKNGNHVFQIGNNSYHLQKFIDGKSYSRNAAPEWLLYGSARMLGKIQTAMEKLPLLPTGINQGFFDNMTPERAKLNYASTLDLAKQNSDGEIIEAVNSKVQMLDAFKNFKFDVSRMTCKNTHGDYKINQIICGKDEINAIVDFTSACIHPICWEIIRSYSLADKDCIDGSINIENFKKYVACFLEYGSLNSYDLKMMPYVYFYQSLVSDYFGQYYSLKNNKHLLLDDALHSVNLCKWFEHNITRLEDVLVSGF